MDHHSFFNRMRIWFVGIRVATIFGIIFSAFGPVYATPVYADKLVCGIPGADGPATPSGIVNTYYPGAADVSAGSTSIPVGSPSGAATPIQPGDLLLVIQMQGADINSTNSGAYGDGSAGDPGSGNLGTNLSAGRYEYVVATSAVAGGTVSISSGLVYDYFEQNYPVGGGNQGQRRFQVIRVPQYSSATLGGTVTALAWTGSVGGVVALDVAGTLNFNGNTINVSGQGFRGGGGVRYTGDSTAGLAATDYRTLSTQTLNASKGEGIAGTPRFVFNGTAVQDLGSEGYPNGSFGRGAPANAGGGGTDGSPTNNEDNTGGGGGGNGGTGGKGGFGWSNVSDSGGFGGTAYAANASHLVMGGGGGAGSINNNDPTLSSGGRGGGIVMVRAGTVSGSGSINANGSDGQDQPLNDSGGGAGAGGSVLVVAQNALPALNVTANGGNGGDAWPGQIPLPFPGWRHGPGAGGGGGVILLSSTAGTLSVAGGQNGITTTANDSYGSNPGSAGIIGTATTASSVTTGISGAECIPNPTVVKTTSTPIVTQTPTGTVGEYTIVASVPANEGTALGFTISDTLPTGFTYASTTAVNLTGGATRPSSSNPAAGSSTPAWGSFDIPGGGQVSITFTVNIASTVPAGVYQNPVTATYLDPTRTTPNGTTDTQYDSGSSTGEDIEVVVPNTPAMTVVKSQTSTGPYVVGDTITYSIVVTNTGNVQLTGVTVTDGSATVGTCTPAQPAALAPGASMTCPASHIVTQADVDNGSYTNTATGDSNQTPPGTSTVIVPFTPNPALSVVKSQTSNGPYAVGDTITYSIVVTNTGNVTLTGVTVTDNSATVGACTPAQPATLAPGASMTCPAAHVVTQADIDSGSYTNTATGDSNETPPDTSTVVVPFPPTPALSVLKLQTSTGPYVAGDTITYSIVVTNTGNTTLTGVTVTDNSATLGACTPAQPATLTPGATMTCLASHTVTAADINNGSYVNTATGDSNETPPGTSTVTVPFAPIPALTVVKSETSNGPYVVGDTITYSIVVTNTGNVNLTGVTVTDNSAAVGTCTPAQPATLAPGATMTCPASHIVTQADINKGSYVNTATADSSETPPSTSTVTVPFQANPSLNVVKSQTSNGPYAVGDTITYSIVVTNTGNVTLTGVAVTDNSATVGACTPAQPATLAPLATMTCLATHVVTAADINNGSYVNTATADSNETPPDTSTVTVDFSVADLSLSKTVSNANPTVGSNIDFTITVSNIGPDPATGVAVTDKLPAAFTFVSYQASQGTYDNVTGVWTVGNLAVNAAATLTITVTVNSGGTNMAQVSAALEIDPDSKPANNKATEDDQDSTRVSLPKPPPTTDPQISGFLIPVTGFRPNVVTDLSKVPHEMYEAVGGVTLEIPSLNVKISIVGVPKRDGTWNVAWLADQAGWLEGSAFPSWNGNSVLTGHAYLASGLPGPFVNLGKLKYGDKVIVHAYGQKYTFAVQTNTLVQPNDTSLMKHEEKPWLTLVTCKDFDEKTNTYLLRVIVRAALVSIENE